LVLIIRNFYKDYTIYSVSPNNFLIIKELQILEIEAIRVDWRIFYTDLTIFYTISREGKNNQPRIAKKWLWEWQRFNRQSRESGIYSRFFRHRIIGLLNYPSQSGQRSDNEEKSKNRQKTIRLMK